jgi:uncharacterized protein
MNKILSKIWIYPFKSLPGIEVNDALLTNSGVEHDRNWMLIDNTGKFITARENPQLFKFSISFNNEKQRLNVGYSLNNSFIHFPIQPESGESLDAELWGKQIKVINPFKEVSDFFSEALQIKVKAVYANQNSNRIIESINTNRFRINLADGYPFLILGEASINHLSIGYNESIDIRRFRPNFVFSGGIAYEEDNWSQVKIGDNTFLCEKKCARCKVVTIDPDSTQFNPQILTLMNQKRKDGNKVMMGMNLSLLDGIKIKKNDTIHAQ